MEGQDRTLGVVYAADDLEAVAGCDFMADDVQISFLPAADGTERIFYRGASTNQGITSYTLGLYKISGGTWEPMETGLPVIDEPGAVYLAGEKVLFATPEERCTAYEWNSESEGFEQADPSGGKTSEREQAPTSFPAARGTPPSFSRCRSWTCPPPSTAWTTRFMALSARAC